METYNLAAITHTLHDSGLILFTTTTLRSLLAVKKESSFFNLLARLVQGKVLVRLERGKYALAGENISDFALANFLYPFSYISLESALNFYGILSQFPYEITSVVTKKTKRKILFGKTFSYVHVKKTLFWGYEKRNGFLIAVPEKALLDQLYLAAKGLRGVSLDEYDLPSLNFKRVQSYLKKYPHFPQFDKIISRLGIFSKR